MHRQMDIGTNGSESRTNLQSRWVQEIIDEQYLLQVGGELQCGEKVMKNYSIHPY